MDESLLIDFPPDTYLHWLRTPFDFLKVTDLLVTHSHMDHWYPDDVQSVVPPYGHHDPSYTLTLHGNERVIQMLEEGMAREEPQILGDRAPEAGQGLRDLRRRGLPGDPPAGGPLLHGEGAVLPD